MDTLDFGPMTTELARLVRGVRDEQLDGRTPCPDWSVADLLTHIAGLTIEFIYAARKEPTPARAGEGLADGWRERIGVDLESLAAAWQEVDAYQGETHAGPVTLPGREAGRVALNEVTVHAWDLAQSTGQGYRGDPQAVAACTEFVRTFDAPAGPGLFGAPVDVAADAGDVDRLVAMTGRDPDWTNR